MNSTNTIYIVESGWIFVGRYLNSDAEAVSLENASVVRSWSNGRGIGGLALRAHKDEYTLDAVGRIQLMKGKILAEIPCEW